MDESQDARPGRAHLSESYYGPSAALRNTTLQQQEELLVPSLTTKDR